MASLKGVDGAYGAGYEFNRSVIPVVQNAAYSAGQCLGGLLTIPISKAVGIAGILQQIQVASKGGSTVGIVVYVWQTNPVNSTFNDRANIVISQVDNEALIIPPTIVTPALVTSAQDTTTYGTAQNLAAPFENTEESANIYVALVANASVTPATVSDLRLNIQGMKDQP